MKIVSWILFTWLVFAGTALAKDTNQYYQIDKDVRILGFVGKPTSSDFQPVLYHTAVKQYVALFHKKSGPGVYAFYLEGVIVKDEKGEPIKAPEGFFCVKRRLVKKYKE